LIYSGTVQVKNQLGFGSVWQTLNVRHFLISEAMSRPESTGDVLSSLLSFCVTGRLVSIHESCDDFQTSAERY